MNKLSDARSDDELAVGRQTIESRFLSSSSGVSRRNLRILRLIIGLNTVELSKATGLSQSLIRSVENGQRPLLIGAAIVIADKTGVDPCSLLVGEALLEWGGSKPFTESVYKAWVDQDFRPSEKQEANGHRQLRNMCTHVTENLNAGHIGDALITAYLYVLVGGVDEQVQYAGIER